MPEEARRVPFRHMIYVGDGPTDVPCFNRHQKKRRAGRGRVQSGRSHAPVIQKMYDLTLHADRVHFMARADYRSGSQLRLILEQRLTEIADGIVERRRQAIAATRVAAPRRNGSSRSGGI